MNHKPKVLKSGTELPLTDLRGKPYMNVAYRLVWFREEHPDWSIQTHLFSHTDKYAIIECTILNEQGRVIATDRKLVTSQSFQAYIEKATTGAIGRALALCGYGTQFDPEEFDEFDPKSPNPVDACDTATAPPNKIMLDEKIKVQLNNLLESLKLPKEFAVKRYSEIYPNKNIKTMTTEECQKVIDSIYTESQLK